MKIAICDDDAAELSRLTSLLNDYKLSKGIDFVVFTYQSPVELISQIQNKGCFDMLILDIIMPSICGIDVAKEIREFDKNVKIIFITSSPDYAVDSYSVGAHHYALKPLTDVQFFCIIDRVLHEIDRQEKEFLLVKCKSGIIRIPFKSLEYCEIINKTIWYQLSNGTMVESNGSLAELEATLIKYPRFFKPHRSFIVNMDFIKSLSIKTILLENGTTISIPRGRYNDIKQAFLDYSFI